MWDDQQNDFSLVCRFAFLVRVFPLLDRRILRTKYATLLAVQLMSHMQLQSNILTWGAQEYSFLAAVKSQLHRNSSEVTEDIVWYIESLQKVIIFYSSSSNLTLQNQLYSCFIDQPTLT